MIPILILPYVTNILSPTSFGKIAYASTIYSFFGLFASFGLSQFATREVAKFKNDNKYNDLLSSLFTFQLLTTLLSTLIYSFFLIAGIIEFNILMAINVLSFFSVFFDITWAYQGDSNFKSIFRRTLFFRILYCFTVFYFVREESDATIYYLITILAQIIVNLSFWFKLYPKPKWRFNSQEFISIYRSTKYFFIYAMIGVVGIGSIKILSQYFNNFSVFGQFELAYKIILILLMIPNSINNVLMPVISKSIYQGSLDSNKDIRIMVLRFNFIVMNIFLLCIYFYLELILKQYFSKDYYLVFDFILILSPMLFLNMLSSFFISQYLMPKGSEKKLVYGFLVINAITIIASLPMLKYLNSYGIAYTVVFGEILTFMLVLHYIKYDFKLFLLLRLSLQYIIPAFGLFCLFYIFHSYLIQNILRSLLLLALLISFYALSYLNSIKSQNTNR